MIVKIYFEDRGFETLHVRLTCLHSLATNPPNTYNENHLMHTIC